MPYKYWAMNPDTGEMEERSLTMANRPVPVGINRRVTGDSWVYLSPEERQRREQREVDNISLARQGLMGWGRTKRNISKWNLHVKKVRKANPNLPMKEVFKKASATYKK